MRQLWLPIQRQACICSSHAGYITQLQLHVHRSRLAALRMGEVQYVTPSLAAQFRCNILPCRIQSTEAHLYRIAVLELVNQQVLHLCALL